MSRTPLQTVMGPKYGGNKTDDELLELVAATIPLGKIGRPEDIANMINFFMSDLACLFCSYSHPTVLNSLKGTIRHRQRPASLTLNNRTHL